MVEMIGLVVISALVWVLIKAMGAERSESERHIAPSNVSRFPAKRRAEQPARHAA